MERDNVDENWGFRHHRAIRGKAMGTVDVAIPCYNYGRFLRACVESIQSQGIEGLRILIIDNASTDNSVEVARQLASEDSRIAISAHRTNRGPHASFNEGIDWAESEYFMILCSDDLLAPGRLADMIGILDKSPDVSFAYGHDLEWDGQSALPARTEYTKPANWRVCDGERFIFERCRYPERLVSYGMILTRTRDQKVAGHYRSELPHSDDFEMLLRMACLGQVASTDAVLGIRRMHQHNRSQELLAERTAYLTHRMDAFQSFFQHEGRLLPENAQLLRTARSSLSSVAYWRGIKDLVRGRATAFDLLKLAFQLDPKTAVVPPVGYLFRMERNLIRAIRGLP